MSKTATFSFDDGGAADADVITIFNRRGLRATFYVPSALVLESVYEGLGMEDIQTLYARHEVGAHGRCHRRASEVHGNALLDEIAIGKRDLEAAFSVPLGHVKCYAYPYGTVTADAKAVLESIGVRYARTCKRGDVSAVRSGAGKDLAAPITCIVRPKNEPWRESFSAALKEERDVHVVSHAWELVRFEMVHEIDAMLATLIARGYAIKTNSEFAGI